MFLVDEKLTLDFDHNRHDFDQLIVPIVVNTDNYLYTKGSVYAAHKQSVLYSKINTKTKEGMPFIENVEERGAIIFHYCPVKKRAEAIASVPLQMITFVIMTKQEVSWAKVQILADSRF